MRLYNTLSRGLEELPAAPALIHMYFCGPTVYARAHIGNARPFILGMWLRNWLRLRDYEATLVHNITDINDRIYDAAPGASAELAERATAWYLEDIGDFGLGMPDELPKATEYIEQIEAFIAKLIEREFAYEVDGDVYFRVSRSEGYGRLSGQRPDQVEDQEPNPRKEDPRDFALWKANKPGEDTWWESPWGRGRPGWHIECSVMAEELLGPVFEIHGGGLDLVFPHHENELAQSNALGHDFAEIWTHNGMLRFVGEKMSKSSGDVTTMREALDEWGKETLLLFFMTAHWRKPIDFSEETLASARAQWNSFRSWDRFTESAARSPDWADFVNALDDDFNTPVALSILHAWLRAGRHELLLRGLDVFGLSLPDRKQASSKAQELAFARQDARDRRDWDEADRLRKLIEREGWAIKDGPDGRWALEELY